MAMSTYVCQICLKTESSLLSHFQFKFGYFSLKLKLKICPNVYKYNLYEHAESVQYDSVKSIIDSIMDIITNKELLKEIHILLLKANYSDSQMKTLVTHV